MKMAALVLTAVVLAAIMPDRAGAGPQSAAAQTGDTPPSLALAIAAWDRTLHAHVRDGGVDYAALAADRGDLDTFLGDLASVRPDELGREDRLAFWINAYNAVVLAHVLELYPGIESVKKVDGFFDRKTFPVAARRRTLDDIEKEARAFGDPRVHFAVVCASASCPDLRGEAYVGARLDAQLEDQTRRFLSDPDKGLRYDRRANDLWLSSIFKWYAGDFTGGSTVIAFFHRGAVAGWVEKHVPAELAETLAERDPSVRYLDYDWSLNDRK